jgi:hypothetical protein
MLLLAAHLLGQLELLPHLHRNALDVQHLHYLLEPRHHLLVGRHDLLTLLDPLSKYLQLAFLVLFLESNRGYRLLQTTQSRTLHLNFSFGSAVESLSRIAGPFPFLQFDPFLVQFLDFETMNRVKCFGDVSR